MRHRDEKPPAVIEPRGTGWWFYCPGCKAGHAFGGGWRRSGTLDRPTFAPSLVTFIDGREGGRVCHLFVRGGQIEFLSDSWHELAGKTVPMEPVT